MIEVFVAYTQPPDVDLLGKTLEAWEIDGLEPKAIQVDHRNYELARRVAAENISTGHYILADVGFGPAQENFGERAEKLFPDNPKVGLFVVPEEDEWKDILPIRVMICRKGIVDKWPEPQTPSYFKEHVAAYRLKDYLYRTCQTIRYRPLAASLPS